jgi:hypothetical protein
MARVSRPRIKVGPYTYKLEPLGDKEAREADARALVNFDEWALRIRPSRRPSEQGALLLHELMHCIFEGFASKKKGLNEEEVCTLVERGFQAVFQDNPGVVRMLFRAFLLNQPIVEKG